MPDNFFEHIYSKYNTAEYIKTDPILFPHTLEGNTEFIAFTAALFAYGNVKAMQKFLYAFFDSCGTDPYTLKPNPDRLKYRFQTVNDVEAYCNAMKRIYNDHGSLEKLFANGALEAFNIIRSNYFDTLTPGIKFLFAIPEKSASKRLWMFLRWMIRKDDVDLGLWMNYNAMDLNFPLDTHVHRMSVSLKIITQNESGVKAREKINSYFRKLSPLDPVKYDFALTRLGIAHKCQYEPSERCAKCAEYGICKFC
ncbi:MAG: TIGR02757 family protein [Deferribacteraceae bacterium]|jgi:uncharacterized protein (TIGR02757 family)|nr:TIGR02757 family protein [Deferribacteraceae bacterium]